MAGDVAIAVVSIRANGDGAAVSRKGNTPSGVIPCGFSIDISANLLPGIGYSVVLINAHMAQISAIAVVSIGANGNAAAVSREGDAPSRAIASGFSIDVCADLFPNVCCGVALINAHMARITAIAAVVLSTYGDGAAVSRKGDASSGSIASGFSIDVSTDLLPDIGYSVALIDAHMTGIIAIAVVSIRANGDGAAVSREWDDMSGLIASDFCIDVCTELLPISRPGACGAGDRQGAGGFVIQIDNSLHRWMNAAVIQQLINFSSRLCEFNLERLTTHNPLRWTPIASDQQRTRRGLIITNIRNVKRMSSLIVEAKKGITFFCIKNKRRKLLGAEWI